MSIQLLSQDVWLTSIQELQKSIQDPRYRRDLSPQTLESLLFSHIDHLVDPGAAFAGPSQSSRSKVRVGERVRIPGTDSVAASTSAVAAAGTSTSNGNGSGNGNEVEVEQEDVPLALELSDRLAIDEVEALVLVKRFQKDERAGSGGYGQGRNRKEDGTTTVMGGKNGIIPRRLAGPGSELSRSRLNASTTASDSNSNSSKPDEQTLTQLTRYFQAESLALVRLLTTIIVRAAGAGNHDPMEASLLASGTEEEGSSRLPIGVKAMRLDFMCERALLQLADHHQKQNSGATLVRVIFSSFARAAHQAVQYKPIGGGSATSSAVMVRSWIVHHLKVQTALLESLFQLVYWSPIAALGSVPANSTGEEGPDTLLDAETAVGLIQGIFGSTFGAQQANARLIESLKVQEAGRWLDKIELLLGLIALETLGLSGISRGTVVPLDEYPPGGENENGEGTRKTLTLVQSKEAVDMIHTTLGTASLETTRRAPFPLVLLAWSFILSRLHPDIVPQGSGDGEFVPVYQTVASIALGEEMQVFEKWTELLRGKGMWKDDRGDVGDDYVVGYKDTMNCLMVALCTIIRPPHVQQFDKLAAVFTSLYGQGPRDAVISVCGDFWRNAASDGRRDVLECAAFPLFPIPLIELLTGLSGAGTVKTDEVEGDDQVDDAELLDVSPRETVKQSFDYFSALDQVTLMFKGSGAHDGGFTRELRGQTVIITLENDLELPCGQVIPAKTQGVLISRSGEDTMVVKWAVNDLSGWRMLVSLMQAALARDEAGRRKAQEWSRFVDTSNLTGVLSAGLGYVRDLLSVDSSLADQLVDAQDLSASVIRSSNKASASDLLSISFALLDQTVVIRQEESWRRAIAPATSIVSILLSKFPQRIWSELRSSGFFTFTRQDVLTLRIIIDRDIQAGEYTSTINALNLIVKLAEHVQLGQFQVDPETVHNRSLTMANTIQFLHQSVWTRYRGWRYTSTREKAQIATALAKLYNSVLRNPTFTAQYTRPGVQLPLNALNDVVCDRLVRTTSEFDLLPLLDTITTPLYGASGSPVHQVDRAPLERALFAALELAYHIAVACHAIGTHADLSILSVVSRTTDGRSETDTLHVIEAVFDIATSAYLEDHTAVAALKFLQILMIQARIAESPFSFMACLRSPQETSDRFVDLLARGARSAEVQDAAWQVLRSMAETQPALARFCLHKDQETKSTALEVAVKTVTQREQVAKADARLLSRSIGLLQDLYDHHADLVDTLQIASDADLWKAVLDFVLEVQPGGAVVDRQAMDAKNVEDDENNVVDGYINRCYLRSAKASAMRLLHTVLVNSASSRDGEIVSRPDVKTSLALLKAGTQSARLLADTTASAFDPELRMEQAGLVQTILPAAYLEMLQNPAPLHMRLFGDVFTFDKDVLRGIFDLPNAERRALLTCFQLISINESATVADEEVAQAAMTLAQSTIDFAREEGVAATTAAAFAAVIGPISEEARDGNFVIGLQNQRYQLLQTLLEATWIGEWHADDQWIRSTLRPFATIIDSGSFPLTLPFEEPSIPAYYRPLVNALILYLRYTRESARREQADDDLALELDEFLRSVVPIVAQLLTDVFTTVQSDPTGSASEDLDLIVSVIGGLMGHRSAGSLCLAHLEQNGLILRSCEIISRPALATPSVLKSITRLHWTIAQVPSGAEKLSVQAVLRVYGRTTSLREFSIHPERVTDEEDVQTIWTTMLSVARSLLQTLPYTAEYVKTEILPFVQDMQGLIVTALGWRLDGDSLLVQLAEVHSILEILLHIARDVETDLEASKRLLRDYSKPVLEYLRQATSALTRPTVIRTKVVQTFGFEMEDSDGNDKTIASAIDAAEDCVIQALLVTSSSAVSLLSEWLSISSAFSRSSSGFVNHHPRLPSVSTHMTASRILVEFASCIIDLDLESSLKTSPDSPRPLLGAFTAIWPAVSEDRLQMIRQQALETTLLVATVQAAGIYLADQNEEKREKAALEKGGNSDKGSTPAKKKSQDRRQGKQDLRDVVDTVKRFRDGELDPVCNVCNIYLEARCGNLSDI